MKSQFARKSRVLRCFGVSSVILGGLLAGMHMMLAAATVEEGQRCAARCDAERENDERKQFQSSHCSLLRMCLADICSTTAVKIQETAPTINTGVADIELVAE